jgi:hybrid cluster-associated redox disulfide protein
MALPFDRNTTVQDILVNWPQTAPVFLKHQMLCVGCYVGPFHTVEDACFEHNIDEDVFWHDLAAVVEHRS